MAEVYAAHPCTTSTKKRYKEKARAGANHPAKKQHIFVSGTRSEQSPSLRWRKRVTDGPRNQRLMRFSEGPALSPRASEPIQFFEVPSASAGPNRNGQESVYAPLVESTVLIPRVLVLLDSSCTWSARRSRGRDLHPRISRRNGPTC
jgi:hypothetical protein